uniref:Protein kinase domain-containing protein n=1 Tax=Macrostomum lignano TaxID=282301 RepID=A0A1I8F3X0_9PLAT
LLSVRARRLAGGSASERRFCGVCDLAAAELSVEDGCLAVGHQMFAMAAARSAGRLACFRVSAPKSPYGASKLKSLGQELFLVAGHGRDIERLSQHLPHVSALRSRERQEGTELHTDRGARAQGSFEEARRSSVVRGFHGRQQKLAAGQHQPDKHGTFVLTKCRLPVMIDCTPPRRHASEPLDLRKHGTLQLMTSLRYESAEQQVPLRCCRPRRRAHTAPHRAAAAHRQPPFLPHSSAAGVRPEEPKMPGQSSQSCADFAAGQAACASLLADARPAKSVVRTATPTVAAVAAAAGSTAKPQTSSDYEEDESKSRTTRFDALALQRDSGLKEPAASRTQTQPASLTPPPPTPRRLMTMRMLVSAISEAADSVASLQDLLEPNSSPALDAAGAVRDNAAEDNAAAEFESEVSELEDANEYEAEAEQRPLRPVVGGGGGGGGRRSISLNDFHAGGKVDVFDPETQQTRSLKVPIVRDSRRRSRSPSPAVSASLDSGSEDDLGPEAARIRLSGQTAANRAATSKSNNRKKPDAPDNDDDDDDWSESISVDKELLPRIKPQAGHEQRKRQAVFLDDQDDDTVASDFPATTPRSGGKATPRDKQKPVFQRQESDWDSHPKSQRSSPSQQQPTRTTMRRSRTGTTLSLPPVAAESASKASRSQGGEGRDSDSDWDGSEAATRRGASRKTAPERR